MPIRNPIAAMTARTIIVVFILFIIKKSSRRPLTLVGGGIEHCKIFYNFSENFVPLF